VLPWLDQRNAQIIALALPINLAVAWTVRMLADRAPAEPTARVKRVRERQRAAA
jgi:hypothetical protein